MNNKLTAPPCWILASGFSLPLPHCCYIIDGPRWLHQHPSSASTTSPNTQGTIANVRVLERWMCNTEHDLNISNRSQWEGKAGLELSSSGAEVQEDSLFSFLSLKPQIVQALALVEVTNCILREKEIVTRIICTISNNSCSPCNALPRSTHAASRGSQSSAKTL